MRIDEKGVKKIIPLYYTIPLLFIFVTILLLFVFIFNISTPVSLQPAILNHVNVSSCGILNQSNTHYTLNRSLVSNGTCIYLWAHNSILDGHYNYTITSTNNTNISFAVENRGNGNTIQRLNISSFFIGIYTDYSWNGYGTKIIGNVIENSHTGIRVVNSVNVSVIQNKIINHTWAGIDFWGSSGLGKNSAEGVYGNFMQRTDWVSRNPSIYLSGSSNFNISSNYIGFSARGLELHSSDNNAFSNNIIRTGESGIFLNNSKGNTFFKEIIDNFITPVESFNSIFSLSNLNITPASSSMNPIDIVDFRSTIYLTNTHINSYNFYDTHIEVINTSVGHISFYSNITATGNSLSSDVKIGPNFVEVNAPAFNKSAWVRLVNLPAYLTNLVNLAILRNGVPCPSNVCVNLTALNMSDVAFNVTGWSNYSIGGVSIASPPPTNPFISIELPYANQVVSSYSTGVFLVSLNQIGKVWFTLNNGVTNVTMVNSSSTNTLFNYFFNSLSEGSYTMKVYANFTGTNFIASSSVNFTVGNLSSGISAINIIKPTTNENYNLSNFPVTFIANLNQTGRAWFTLNNGVTNVTMSNISNTVSMYTQNSLAVGNYTMEVYANFTGTNFIASSSVNFNVIGGTLSSPPSPFITIVEPNTNENYYLSNFPVIFRADLNQAGKVWFTLNDGVTNFTMRNSSNANIYFTYTQNSLAVGNYTMKVYANFTGTSQKATASRNFRVMANPSPPGSPPSNFPPANQTNTTSSSFPDTPYIPPTGDLATNTNNLSKPEEKSSGMGSVAFWLIMIILIVAIGVLVFFILQTIKSKKINQNIVPNNSNNYPNIVNRLR